MTELRIPLLVTACFLLPRPAAADSAVDYTRDIKPLLLRSCISCHGPAKQRGGLRVDTVAALMEGGNSGPAVIPGQAGASRLVKALTGADGVVPMPLKQPPLSAAEITRIRAWIDQGAKGSVSEIKVQPDAPKVVHWAFRPIQRPGVPAVKRPSWVRNPIDAFILARLEKEGMAPSPETDRVTLLRRAALDLTGLPPTLEEVDAFLQDATPDAFERQIERLLASPHYGERWAQVWLDLARYADSQGYANDPDRTIWPYRDWVIHSLNRDLPFDQFTTEQLAGDLLPNATLEQKIATGFHRNTQINEEGGVDPEQFRVEAVIDRVNTTGSVWLGLTVGCCQCHNHKFDPISQREYYQLFAFFNNQDEPRLPLASADPAVAPSGRARRGPQLGLTTMVLQERATPRETHLLQGGDFTRKGMVVTPGTPAVLPPLHRRKEPDASSTASPTEANRLDLARWLVSTENPLTARVVVNRIWGHYFGLGLVETENDFGTQGTPPSHPELLDWLAAEFMQNGW